MEEVEMKGHEEKIEIEGPRGNKLSGILNTPEEPTEKLVIISHGLFANKDRYRLRKASYRFLKAGFATLRYDFSTCGGEEDVGYDVEGNTNELRAFISYSRSRGYLKIALLGESYGGLISLLGYDRNISTLVLWGPVTANRTPTFLEKEEYQKEMNERGYAVFRDDGEEHKITRKYVEDRNSIDRESLLGKIKCPTLIIHGTADDQIPHRKSEEAIELLPKGSKIILVERGNHSLDNRIDKVIQKTRGWLREKVN